jgi:hypothetical protein
MRHQHSRIGELIDLSVVAKGVVGSSIVPLQVPEGVAVGRSEGLSSCMFSCYSLFFDRFSYSSIYILLGSPTKLVGNRGYS